MRNGLMDRRAHEVIAVITNNMRNTLVVFVACVMIFDNVVEPQRKNIYIFIQCDSSATLIS